MSPEPSVVVTTLVEVDPVTAFEIFTEDVEAWWKQGPRYRVQPESNPRSQLLGGSLRALPAPPGEWTRMSAIR